MLQPRENDLQVWFIPQLGGPVFTHLVTNPEEGAYVLDAIAQYDLYCDRHGLRPDFSNAGGINRYENVDGKLDWFTYYDDETGEEIEDIYDIDLEDPSHRFVLTFDTQRRRVSRRGLSNALEPLLFRFPTKALANAAEVALIQYQRFVFQTDSDSRVDEVDA